MAIGWKISDKPTVDPTDTDLVLLEQGGLTRNTTWLKSKNYILGAATLLTTDKTMRGAVNEVKAIADSNTTSLLEKAKQTDLAQLSNPNLLINGDFQVWQRGTSFVGADGGRYSADRWFINNAASIGLQVDKVSTGLKMTWLKAGNNILEYLMEEKATLIGKVISVSIKVDGVIYSYSTTLATMNDYIRFDLSTKTFAINTGGSNQIAIYINNANGAINTTYTFNYVKLELGSKATPFVPRLYGEELVLCQRYYRQDMITSICGRTINLYDVVISAQNNPKMRTTPTTTFFNVTGLIQNMVSDANGNNVSGAYIVESTVDTVNIQYNSGATVNLVNNIVKSYVKRDAEIY